jgi:plasmid stabilization system protein ParE
VRHSRYARAFLADSEFARSWLHDLRAHAALALIMARASAASVGPAALTRRGISDLTTLSMSAVHAMLAEACARGDFRRDADAGDRRRVLLLPTQATASAFTTLVAGFVQAASGGGLHPALAAAAAQEPQVLALYARFACGLVAARRPGGKLWVQPASLALLGDLMTGGQNGVPRPVLQAIAARRGVAAAAVEEDLAFAAMAGLAETTTDGRVRLTQDGRQSVLGHLEIWRAWSGEGRLAVGALAAPMSVTAMAA